jgi:hypothetical protein
MQKLIEMTMDGRLSMVWAFLAFVGLAAVLEGWSFLRGRNRRVSSGQRQRKY